MAEEKKYCCAFSLGFIFLLSVILFAVSFDTLNPHSIGIKYNNNLKSIDTKRVYSNGRYFLGLGLSFIDFPLSASLIEFANDAGLRMWTQEGQLVIVDMSLMYRLEREQIVLLYKRYKQDYHSRLEQITIRTVKKVSIQYTAEDFFQRRGTIGDHMRSELRLRLAQEYCTLEIFNLRKITIPEEFERKVISKQIKEQIRQTRVYEKNTSLLRARKNIILGVTDANISLAVNSARALQNEKIQIANAHAMRDLTSQEAASYDLVQNLLGISGSKILQYRYSKLMETLEQSNITDRNLDNLQESSIIQRNIKYLVGLKQKMFNLQSVT